MRKHLLNTMRLAVFMGAWAYAGIALGQNVIDPQITAIQVAPNAIPIGTTAIASVSFGVGGQGNATAPIGSIIIQVSFPNSYRPVPEANPTITSSNGLFTLTYNQVDRTVNGVNNVPIAPGDGTQIDITVGGLPGNSQCYHGGQPHLCPATHRELTDNDTRSTVASVTGAPNPVSLISFNAQKEAQTAVLSWSYRRGDQQRPLRGRAQP